MGYYTDYSVRITGFEDQESVDFFEFKEMYKETGAFHDFKQSTNFTADNGMIEFCLIECKWYDWEKDLKEISKRYPYLMIEVEGVGEEFPDIWKARVRNGKSEIMKAEIVFPEFKEIV